MNPRPVIIAHHLIFTGYGHWLPNDPRGSGSTTVHMPHLADLGEVHVGRKRVQPPRSEVREFYAEVKSRLKHETLWFDDAKRQALANAFSIIAERSQYTVYACAILRNHAHLCVRRHRDNALAIWHALANQFTEQMHAQHLLPHEHPLWSARPSKVFLHTPDEVRRIIKYVQDNPIKEGLPPQKWNFVKQYDNWSFPGNMAQ